MKTGNLPANLPCPNDIEEPTIALTTAANSNTPPRQNKDRCSHILDGLSDWQKDAATTVKNVILDTVEGKEVGPLYIPMPTGSGKTTGAILGIVECVQTHPDERICFITPYKTAVDAVHQKLSDHLGFESVGRYHSELRNIKSEELQKQVVVVTHEFISNNEGRLDDRTLWIVDEAIYSTAEYSFTMTNFTIAKDWARQNGILSEEFSQLFDFAYQQDLRLRATKEKFLHVEFPNKRTWIKAIALDFDTREHSQSIGDLSAILACQQFCRSLMDGKAFLAKSSQMGDKKYENFNAASLGLPNPERTIVLSATGGLIYDLGQTFKPPENFDQKWAGPDYRNLEIIQLPDAGIHSAYSYWGSHSLKVEEYVDWVLHDIDAKHIYLTLPKKVIDLCLRSYFELPLKGEMNLPKCITKHSKTIHLSHHGISVGSNEFNDCDAVVYLWENHLPQAVSVQRHFTLSGHKVTEEALIDANGKLSGNYEKIRVASLVENMIQHIGRGNVRNIAGNGEVGHMKAYILCAPKNFHSLTTHFLGCSTTEIESEQFKTKSSPNRVARVLNYLKEHGGEKDVPSHIVSEAVGFEMKLIKKQLQNNNDLRRLGYEYTTQGVGRGKHGCFKWVGTNRSALF